MQSTTDVNTSSPSTTEQAASTVGQQVGPSVGGTSGGISSGPQPGTTALARTGADTGMLLTLGLGSICIGLGLVARSRLGTSGLKG